jgi:hypothetical protein
MAVCNAILEANGAASRHPALSPHWQNRLIQPPAYGVTMFNDREGGGRY